MDVFFHLLPDVPDVPQRHEKLLIKAVLRGIHSAAVHWKCVSSINPCLSSKFFATVVVFVCRLILPWIQIPFVLVIHLASVH